MGSITAVILPSFNFFSFYVIVKISVIFKLPAPGVNTLIEPSSPLIV